MFVWLGKVLLPLVQPLGVSLLLWVLALALRVRGHRRWALGVAGAGIAVVLVCSAPLVGESMLGALEDDYPVLTPDECPGADAIVVLGGITAPPLGRRRGVEVGEGFDRLLEGMRLLRAGKAPRLILSGGVMTELVGSSLTEARRLRQLALEYGVRPEQLLLEERSRTTYENALYVAELMEQEHLQRVLLVTSAAHMRRAMAVFRTQGVDAVPVPTDIQVVPRPFHPGRLLPSFTGLEQASRALKEYVGWWVYRLRGWIDADASG